MNDIFNRVKILKSGEDCDKFFKSVSCETLVIGAATTGTGIKQTRRLFLSSADKPLSAVGTLTSLLCNSAKVMEKWLQTLPVFRLVKIIILISVLSVGMVAESRAEVINCVNGKYADGTTCEKCGDNCNWSFDTVSGKLNVSGSGNMYNYSASIDNETNTSYTTAPWKIYQNEIKSVKVEGLSTIGKYAFCHSGGKLTAVEMSDTVTDINDGAFAWNHAISTIKLSDSLKKIGYIAFRAGSGGFSPSIIVPDTLEEVGKGSLGLGVKTIQNMQIICLGDEQSCARVKNLFNEYKHYGDGGYYDTLSLAGNVVVANYEQCTSGNYFWNGAGCVREPDVSKRKCCSSCKDMGGWCNRIRYTPAEAAKVLKDDNTNSVTITFKK